MPCIRQTDGENGGSGFRMMKPAGAGPAVGPAVNCLVAVAVDDAAQLGGEWVDQLVPANFDEFLGAPRRTGPRAVL